MQQSDITSISDAIKDCLRCGKCKPVCSTHVPRANLLYSPRNKILATSLLIEAFLYEEQTRRGVSIQHWDAFSDVADHCTVCHKLRDALPRRHRLRRRVDGDARPAAPHGQAALQPRQGRVDVLPEHDQPRDDQGDAQADDRLGLQGPAARPPDARRARQGADEAPARDHRRSSADARAGDPLRQQEDAGRPAEAHRPRAARHRGPQLRAGDPRPGAHHERVGGRVLLPGLRLGATVLAGGSRDAGDALARGRADRAAAGLHLLRLSRSAARASSTRPRRSSPTTGCCSTASRTRSTTSTSAPWW